MSGMCVPESLCVKVHAAIGFISHVVAHDGLNVLHNLHHVLADSGHDIWPPHTKGIHVFQKLCLISCSMLPVQQHMQFVCGLVINQCLGSGELAHVI